ncbi:hypothetical protein BAUCODRAFT_418809 [Baudoinia panamericana UAMH 10762]|uniref:Uncharacterized protein n=1 Tax=Baudoinia panamericana (strain UAMH 10762) TaxID=717646 RepID=M2MNJ5_BAUPA|nr:uncharacterized protein BAUCODRAFT_418809 [Baudoinia panamericana UAMH 10762]EMC98261.1 hypothetical protein BAUCODRAFT_418809 [Baudoinia panamericana UAMH 10762]
MAPYRPSNRSNRSGRSQADNDVFEGLPVKQWGEQFARISLAPPASETAKNGSDRWGEPPMPRDYQLLLPWTQQLLRLARSGKVGTKRKADPDSMDEDRPDEEAAEESKANLEDRGYTARKWKPIPEALLEPEHKHFEYLAKRRKGLPSLYGQGSELANGGPIIMRKTKVKKAGADGETVIYEALVPEGQALEGEVTEPTELADVKPVTAAPGTVIEGVGIANEDGVFVAEHLKPAAVAPRRNRPPPKKKGGPGRGKKRVTFTNPDGSTYTKIVPNATKIVPQPGQTVKHVSKGEEAAEQKAGGGEEEGEEEGGDDDDDEGDEEDEDDDREDGELSDDDAPATGVATPAQSERAPVVPTSDPGASAAQPPPATEPEEGAASTSMRELSSSPEMPLAKTSHSRQGSVQLPAAPAPDELLATEEQAADGDGMETNPGDGTALETFDDGEEDLLGNLEKHLNPERDEGA